MDDFATFDPGLFEIWTDGSPYRGHTAEEDRRLAEEARSLVLEIKSAESAVLPAEALRRLLNEMTVEMRDQFAAFRRMRTAAELVLADGDEAAGKLARADVKAATDAMSLIVRTLEKVDSLQRQLARDRELEAEQTADEGGYEEAKARLLQLIEDRANEKATAIFDRWKRDGAPNDRADDDQPGAGPARGSG
ncbi:hypothetical protein [Rhizobium deserti]|uniref:hypothetical protein n=1 Tax=Rhizobium deserti TaxID=2547961 RepID=UPI00192A516D|nr:hypothetical protein [Rhizobium deserti]